jgi:predicted nucleotidyltransferase
MTTILGPATQTPGAAPAGSPAARQQALAELCRRYHVRLAYAFGSRAAEALAWARGDVDALNAGGADIDIGVLAAGDGSGGDLTIDEKVGLTHDLEDLLGHGRVDLVTFTEASPFLAVNVIRGERLYLADERLADEFELFVLRRAGDLEPFERQRRAMILGLAEPA